MATNDEQQQVMTSERLAEIERWASNYHLSEDWKVTNYLRELLAEVERLRAQMESDQDATWKLVHAYNERGEQLQAALAVVRAVADGIVMELNNRQIDEVIGDGLLLPLQGHLKEQARALLASSGDGEQAAQGEE